MEKKVSKNFYYLSAINLIPAFWLGGGLTLDSLALVAVLGALVFNYVALIHMVGELTASMSDQATGKSPLARLLTLFGVKVLMLGALVGIIFFYKKDLITDVILMMIFQLIIQFVSITTNHLKN
jgi:hypothetical protein